jgi:hypothetical protein
MMRKIMRIRKVILERFYKAAWPIQSETDYANFSYCLELKQNHFNMCLGDWDSFINNTIDVCNWPIEKWTIEQVRECVRIFDEEYMPCCSSTSGIVDKENVVQTSVFLKDEEYKQSEPVYGDDITATLWSIISDPSNEWITDDDAGTFMVRDSIHDMGYVEDPFPFVGTTNEFGQPVESPVEFYQKYLPTLMALAKK